MPLTQTLAITPAQRLDNLRYAIRDLVGLANEVKKQGHKILFLNVGDPNIFDFATPSHVIEAAYRAMRDNKNGYAPSEGVPEALEAIRAEAVRGGISSVQDVFITNGAGEAVDVCLTALLNPGENVLTPSPDYPLYTAVLCKTGAEMNSYFLNEEDGWQPELDDIRRKINPRTRAIILINPNNPTGALCTRRVIEKLSGSGMAHRMGHCKRRSCRREAVHRRHPQTAAGAALSESSRAICDQSCARRAPRSFDRGAQKTQRTPGHHRRSLQLHSADELRRSAWRLLRFPED